VAILAGGIISGGVLIAGTGLGGGFSFDALAGMLADRLGPWARFAFALGLGAAGFSSALTAPLAAALTARGLFERDGDHRWSQRSWRYRAVWGFVLIVGLAFAAAGVRPVPAIIAAQALNGAILPLVAVFLFLIVNDVSRMREHVNGPLANVALFGCVAVSILLGVSGALHAVARGLELGTVKSGTLLAVTALILGAVSVPMLRAARRR
jgi:Mn2+/Fe2+ NRAMP family transporter